MRNSAASSRQYQRRKRWAWAYQTPGVRAPARNRRARLRVELPGSRDQIGQMKFRPFDIGDDHRRRSREARGGQFDASRNAERGRDAFDRGDRLGRALALEIAARDRDPQAVQALGQFRQGRLRRRARRRRGPRDRAPAARHRRARDPRPSVRTARRRRGWRRRAACPTGSSRP